LRRKRGGSGVGTLRTGKGPRRLLACAQVEPGAHRGFFAKTCFELGDRVDAALGAHKLPGLEEELHRAIMIGVGMTLAREESP
jgi:hypothetical protein